MIHGPSRTTSPHTATAAAAAAGRRPPPHTTCDTPPSAHDTDPPTPETVSATSLAGGWWTGSTDRGSGVGACFGSPRSRPLPPVPNNIVDAKALQDADVAVTMDLSNPKAHMRRAAVLLTHP